MIRIAMYYFVELKKSETSICCSGRFVDLYRRVSVVLAKAPLETKEALQINLMVVITYLSYIYKLHNLVRLTCMLKGESLHRYT